MVYACVGSVADDAITAQRVKTIEANADSR